MTLKFWNVFGLSNEGLLFPDGTTYYYLKDHLGSIRAVYDNRLSLVSAQDYDTWGYELTGRTYIDTLKYKFTGKERDKESTYDYFGARYYDSRIGRWGQIDLLINKYPSFSPYIYAINNPVILIDPNGLWIPDYDPKTNKINVRPEQGDNLQSLVVQLGISSEKFVQDQMNLGINNFEIIEGETSFDITQYVTPNTSYESGAINSNCFGFCIVSKSNNSIENSSDENNLRLTFNPLSVTTVPKSGDLAFFIMDKDVIELDNTISNRKGDAGHVAIFIIKDKSGEPYYLNRKTLGMPVTKNTQKELNEYFKNFQERNKKYYKQLPMLNNEPIYYKK